LISKYFFYFRDIQHIHDMSQNDAKETYNIRLFIQSLHNATYQHRLEYVDKFELN
jgi:2-phosphoglycerate kinase